MTERLTVAMHMAAGLLAGGESAHSDPNQVADRAVVHADALLRRLGEKAAADGVERVAG